MTATNSERILPLPDGAQTQLRSLYSIALSRQIEATFAQGPASRSLMKLAGLAIARLVMAVAPHAKSIWIACGPGHNGGDGLAAAAELARFGKKVTVSECAAARPRDGDARLAQRSAIAAGVKFTNTPPENFDFCVDALFGIGKSGDFGAPYDAWIAQLNATDVPVLAVDVPSGLNADTGKSAAHCVRADFTLSLLTLKPGLFTADGRARVGEVWLNTLANYESIQPTAHLSTAPIFAAGLRSQRPHNTHKGSFGDVAIIGGDHGMVGAALLAGRAALLGGAGRVFVGVLTPHTPAFDVGQPELMFRDVATLVVKNMAVVAGCGGGNAVAQHLLHILQYAQMLVLDADALNHVATSVAAQALLAQRMEGTTVLTPHPLEAARLLGTTVAEVQADRLLAAQTLAQRWSCVVVLKGSGTVIAGAHEIPTINSTGNAQLATAGTGDVLAGLLGSYLAQGMEAFDAACLAVFQHGRLADRWPSSAGALTASGSVQAL